MQGQKTSMTSQFKSIQAAPKTMPVMSASQPNQNQPRAVAPQMSMSRFTSNAGTSSANIYKSVATNVPSVNSAVAPKKSFNYGNTPKSIFANMSAQQAQTWYRSGNVAMKAHPDSFMPEFSVKGSGGIPL
jgi:hypothetical protein